jgi:hypothetical protein
LRASKKARASREGERRRGKRQEERGRESEAAMNTDDLSLWKAFAVLLGVSSPMIIFAGYQACRGNLKRAWRSLRVRALGGVTTLERKLSYNCAICMDSMDVLEVVRTLSCNHVFHCGESDKCKDDIDKWLRDQPTMSCPVCRETPRLVLPWKAPPPSAPAPAPVPAPLADQEQPESPSGLEDTAPSDLEDPPVPRSSPVLEEPLLQPSQ